MHDLKQLEFDLLKLVGSLNLRPILDDAIRAGELLARAKDAVPYRDWASWLSRLRLTQRSAHDYMACYRHQSQRPAAEITIKKFLEFVRAAGREARRTEREQLRAALAGQTGPLPSGMVLENADAREYGWPLDIDLVATDPPWGELWSYEWLATWCAGHLKSGGLALVQSGTKNLDRVMAILGGSLTYVWTLAIVYQTTAQARVPGRWRSGWRPVLVYANGKPGKLPVVSDVYTVGPGSPQDLHKWQQPVEPWKYWVERLTEPGDLVADPFTGSGTTPVICRDIGRRFVGTERDERNWKIATGRLST